MIRQRPNQAYGSNQDTGIEYEESKSIEPLSNLIIEWIRQFPIVRMNMLDQTRENNTLFRKKSVSKIRACLVLLRREIMVRPNTM